MQISIGRIWSLIIKEFLATLRDPKSRIMIILPPLLQLLIFAHAATMEIKNVDVVILDKSNTVQSRELIAGFHHSQWFRNVMLAKNEVEVNKIIRSQKAQIGVEIQSDFAKNLLNEKSTNMQIIVDGRQTNTASIANGYAIEIINTYEAKFLEHKKRKGPGIRIEQRSWFNPNLEYMWYTLVSLVALLSLSVSMLLTAMSIARERELGTFDQLIVSPLTSFEILMGKVIPPLIIAVCLTLFMVFAVAVIFKVPFAGSLSLLVFASTVALLSIVGIGLFISAFCKTQQQALLSVFVFQMPMVLLSGFISPINDMPEILQHATILNPVRFYIVIVKGMFLKGMGWQDVFMNLVPLVFLAIITLSIASWMFKRNLD